MRHTINQIVAKLQEFQENHPQLNEFGFGDIGDLLNKKDHAYAMMFGVLRPAGLTDKLVDVNIDILFADILHKDKSNQTEIWSDLLQVALDLRAWLDNDDFADYFIATASNPEPFTDRFDDEVAGWRMPVRFRVIDLKDRCAIPD
jgi:hypothetical protein